MRLSNQVRKNSKVLFVVSILDKKQSGKNFTDMVDLIVSTSEFISGTLLLTGALQRFTIKLCEQLSDEEAFKRAKEEEQKWIVENQIAIEKLKETKNFTIEFWDEILIKEEFIKAYMDVDILCQKDRDLKHAINGLSGNFYRKFTRENEIGNYKNNHSIQMLREYVEEESAMVVYKSRCDYDYELYYGKRNTAMRISYEKLGEKGKLIFISILNDETKENFLNPSDQDMMYSALTAVKVAFDQVPSQNRRKFLMDLMKLITDTVSA